MFSLSYCSSRKENDVNFCDVKRYKHINFTGFLFMQSNFNVIKLVSNNFVIHFFKLHKIRNYLNKKCFYNNTTTGVWAVCSTVELHLSRLIGTASHTDIQKIQMIGFFFENSLYWQSAVQLLLFAVCSYV